MTQTDLPPWLTPALASVLASRAHAQLVEGASGLGPFELAHHAAAAWLCDTALADRPQGLACGRCDSCRAVAAHTHHDLLTLLPEALGLELGVPLNPKAQDAIDKGERKPSKQIRVDAVLGLVEFAQQTSARGHGKVALVYPAERMNDVSANALLKVLEEPPGDLRFLLVCESGAGVMPTIRSRCQTVRLTPPDTATASAWLAARHESPEHTADAARAASLLRASGGLPMRAVAWATAGMSAERWAGFAAQVTTPGAAAADVMAGLTVPQAVEMLQKLCHDLAVAACGGTPRFFAEADLARASRGGATISMAALQAWWVDLSWQARHAEHPVVAALTLDALVMRARRALHSGAA
jgi:DNA polymerase-3 subunit delta'